VTGSGVVDVRLDTVALLPGTYDIHTSVTDFNRAHIFDHTQLAMRVDVMNGGVHEVGGVVTMRPEWTLG
jgi:hypothetical protein